MQSKTVTIVLALVTILFGSLAGVQIAQDDLHSVFGAPPRPAGELLYQLELDEIHTVKITNSTGDTALFKKQGGAWIMHEPITDRADYRDLQRIVYFSANLRVEDVIARDETTLEETGMRETGLYRGRYKISLTNDKGRQVAEYRLGRRTAWHRLNEESGEAAQTFFVRPNEKSQKEYIYVCSAPSTIKPSVREILDRGFQRLRDHRPFLFDPSTLAEITIRRPDGEVVLSRASKTQPWRMIKPLESRTKPDTMAGLLKGLYELQAIQVHDRGSVTIPPRPPALEIEMLHFDADGKRQKSPRKLTVEQPSPDDAETVYASTADRPGVIFELPYQLTPGRIAILQLPLKVDQLRGRTLASLQIPALRSISIYHLNRPGSIELGRDRRTKHGRWMVSLDGQPAPANEITLGGLLHAVSRNEVIGYASDAARDLQHFGLSPPQKRLILRGGEDEVIDLLFGRGAEGGHYAMRRGSSTVAEITPETFAAITAQPHDWRDTILMPFSVVDLSVLKIERPVRPPYQDPALTLNYSFLDESWTARQYGEDATPRLVTTRANQLLGTMEELRVEHWLGDSSPAAERALQQPTFRFTAVFREVDENGDRTGVRRSSFELAPVSQSASNRYYYGRIVGDPYFFVLGPDAFQRITAPLVEGE